MYVGNNPVNYIDPTGHVPIEIDRSQKGTVVIKLKAQFVGFSDAGKVAAVAGLQAIYRQKVGDIQLQIHISEADTNAIIFNAVDTTKTCGTNALGCTRMMGVGVNISKDLSGDVLSEVTAHEFGHKLGLYDLYSVGYDEASDSYYAIPKVGFEDNLMSGGGTALTSDQVQAFTTNPVALFGRQVVAGLSAIGQRMRAGTQRAWAHVKHWFD